MAKKRFGSQQAVTKLPQIDLLIEDDAFHKSFSSLPPMTGELE